MVVQQGESELLQLRLAVPIPRRFLGIASGPEREPDQKHKERHDQDQENGLQAWYIHGRYPDGERLLPPIYPNPKDLAGAMLAR